MSLKILLNILMFSFGSSTESCNTESLDNATKLFEIEYESKLLIINHKRISNSIGGIDLNFFNSHQQFDFDTAKVFLDTLRSVPSDSAIDIILNTTGGSIDVTEIMIKALLNHKGTVRVHIPYYAEDNATLFALAANEIHIGAGGWLSQINPQVGYLPAKNILEYCPSSNADSSASSQSSWINDLARLAGVGAQKAIDRIVNLIKLICEKREYSEQEYQNMINLFVKGGSSQGKPITQDDLNISYINFDIDSSVLDIFNQHSLSKK